MVETLATTIIVLYAFRILIFWFKAFGLNDWFREGLASESFWPTMIVAYTLSAAIVGAFIGTMFCIHRIVNGRWYG